LMDAPPSLPVAVPSAVRSVLAAVVDRSVDGVGPFRGAVEVANEHLAQHSDPEAAVSAVIRTHERLAGASGFVTGLGGLAALPVTLPAGVSGLYLTSARMTAAIAHLRGYDVATEEVRSAVVMSLVGTTGAEVVKKGGVRAANRFLAAAVRRMSAGPLLVLNRAVGFRLVTKGGTTGVVNLAKVVPVVGGPVSAAVDVAACRAIARYAKSIFPPRPSSSEVIDTRLIEP
jgi:hypothetical protein